MNDKEDKKLSEEELDAVSGAGWRDVTDWFKKNISHVGSQSAGNVNAPAGKASEGEAPEKAD